MHLQNRTISLKSNAFQNNKNGIGDRMKYTGGLFHRCATPRPPDPPDIFFLGRKGKKRKEVLYAEQESSIKKYRYKEYKKRWLERAVITRLFVTSYTH